MEARPQNSSWSLLTVERHCQGPFPNLGLRWLLATSRTVWSRCWSTPIWWVYCCYCSLLFLLLFSFNDCIEIKLNNPQLNIKHICLCTKWFLLFTNPSNRETKVKLLARHIHQMYCSTRPCFAAGTCWALRLHSEWLPRLTKPAEPVIPFSPRLWPGWMPLYSAWWPVPILHAIHSIEN